MAQWQIFTKGFASDRTFDDGLWPSPGENGFSTDAVRSEMKTRGADGFSYIGRSTVVSSKMEDQIGDRSDDIAASEIQTLTDKLTAYAISAVPDDVEPDMDVIQKDVQSKVNEQSAAINDAARLAALKDMGLAQP